jgi:hypothetical protein
MSDTAAAQLKRILDLIPRLADGDEHPIDEVAKAAGTDATNVLRDLESVSERFDVPGGFVEGVNIFVDEGNVCLTRCSSTGRCGSRCPSCVRSSSG